MKLNKIIDKINKFTSNKVFEVAIVAGSGHSSGMPELKNKLEITYTDLGLPKSKVKGHVGKFLFGEFKGKNIVIASRIHYYESGDMELVKMPYKIMQALGVKNIILLTASGGLNKKFNIADIVLIKDHINFTGTSPFIGDEAIEFLDLSEVYNKKLKMIAKKSAKLEGLELKEGVHIQFSGPTYETLAEVKMASGFGADSVSMSTVLDALICHSYNMNILAFSTITDLCFENDKRVLTHDEVLKVGTEVCKKLKPLLTRIIKSI